MSETRLSNAKSFNVRKPDERRRFVASVYVLNVARFRAVTTDASSLCSQIARELNQVLGNMNTAAPSQQNSEARLTNGDSNQAKQVCRLRLKCDGTRAETRFRLSAKRTSPFKSAGASVQSTTGSRGVRISVSYAGYTMFRGSVKGTGYPLHSPVSPSLPLPCVTLCHHI